MVDPRVAFWELQLLDPLRNLSKLKTSGNPMGRLPRKTLPPEKKLTPAQVENFSRRHHGKSNRTAIRGA